MSVLFWLQISYLSKLLKRALSEKDSNAALAAYTELTHLITTSGVPHQKTDNSSSSNMANRGCCSWLNVSECSILIEVLVSHERASEAAALAEDMLVARGTYPAPKIFRFLLNKLAAAGDVDAMNR